MKTFSVLFIILVAFHACRVEVYSQKKSVNASYCKLSLLPEGIMQANATFTNHYVFRISADNKPVKVNRAGKGFDYISDEEVKTCINSWTFKDFAENAYLIVSISWVHGEGWRPIKIWGKGFSKFIKVQSER